jgi:hypothetical protein
MPEHDQTGPENNSEHSDMPDDVPQKMLDDLLQLAQVDEEPVRQIAEELAGSTGVLSAERVAAIVNEHLPEDVAEPIARIVANIAPGELPSVLRTLDGARRFGLRGAEALSDSALSRLKKHLHLLVQDSPALGLMRKAQRLLREIGNEVQSIMYVCDLRPVFDDDHTEVVGFVPLINMQIGYTKQSGEVEFFEAALAVEELQEVITRGQDALKKLEMLDAMLYGTSEGAETDD